MNTPYRAQALSLRTAKSHGIQCDRFNPAARRASIRHLLCLGQGSRKHSPAAVPPAVALPVSDNLCHTIV